MILVTVSTGHFDALIEECGKLYPKYDFFGQIGSSLVTPPFPHAKVLPPGEIEDLMKLNNPTVTDEVDPARLKKVWPEIRRLIKETLPSDEDLLRLMRAAGAATEPEDVAVSPELLEAGLRYHAYMRRRVVLTRLLPVLQLDNMDYLK
mgnify:CR=1 FL=1